MKLIVSGGGTGGHIYPAIAIAKEAQQRLKGLEVVFVGTSKGLEASVVPKQGLAFRAITVEGWPRVLSWKMVTAFFKMFKGFGDSWKVLGEIKPDIVIGTGGYVCGPVVLAAILRGIPTMLHESNLSPGMTVKLLSRLVSKVLVSFEETKTKIGGSTVLTGTPITPEILRVQRQRSYEAFGFDPAKPTVFVLGGSQGAHSINLAMVEALTFLAEHQPPLQVLFMTGLKDYQYVLDECEKNALKPVVKSFLYNMPEAYAVADLVVSRAGAMTVAEITARGIPAVLIPYPHSANQHQARNAELLRDKGAAQIIDDKDLSGVVLSRKISEILGNAEQLKKMAQASKALGNPKAGEKIVAEIQSLLEARKKK